MNDPSNYIQNSANLVFNNDPTAILNLNTNGLIVSLNDEARRALEISEEFEPGVLSFFDFILPEYRTLIQLRFGPLSDEVIQSDQEQMVILQRSTGDCFQALLKVCTAAHSRSNSIKVEFTDLSDIKGVLAKMKETDRRYRELFESMRSGVTVYARIEGRFIIQELNRSAENMLNVKRESVIGKDVREAFPSVQEIGLLEVFERVLETGNPEILPVRNYDDERIDLWVENYVYRLPNNYIVAVYDDLTIQKQSEADSILTSTVFRFSREAIVITDSREKILRVNNSFSRITGYEEIEVLGYRPAEILKSDQHNDLFYNEMWTSINRTGYWNGEIWNRKKDGSLFPAWQNISAATDENGNVRFYISIFNDVSDRKFSEERIDHLARFDLLTDLPNRTQFNELLHHALEKARRNNAMLSVLSLNLDRFRSINESIGHKAGDELLIKATRRIASRIRNSDIVARVGGDEFLILVEDIPAMDDPARLAQDLNSKFSEPFQINNREIFIGCSIGIAFYPNDGGTAETIIRNADMAMVLSKKKATNSFHLFSQEIGESVKEKFEIGSGLKNAIRDKNLRIAYQPQISLSSGKVTGLEALLRWKHPQLGEISPERFIPIAEDTGHIIEIGEWVLQESCKKAVRWNQEFGPIRIGVNLSTVQLLHKDTVRMVKQVLEDTGLPPDLLELEITESFVMNDLKAGIRRLQELRKIGVRIALDDFGTGYSSLSYLKNLPVDRLKIDKSFVFQMIEDRGSMAITLSILLMARNLEIGVIAEGTETLEHVELLQNHGCDEAQGYYFSKPLEDEEQLIEFIKDRIEGR